MKLSTSEVDTGKTWIDGKKIYRKAGSKSGSFGLAAAHDCKWWIEYTKK